MDLNKDKSSYSKAKEKLKHVKIFYMHLIGYIIAVGLMLYNIYILDGSNPHADFFLWFNSIIILAWTVFIILHGRWALKGKVFFSKSWEDKKAKEFIEKANKNKNETTLWE
jgi:hypothetical protein